MIGCIDKVISITEGESRNSTVWTRRDVTVGDFFDSLKTPFVSQETYEEYMALDKATKDVLKDVAGGFVGGTFSGTRRKASEIVGRDLITLDCDEMEPEDLDRLYDNLDSAGIEACVYSTRKHCKEHPRVRVLILPSRTIKPEEYEPVSRGVMNWLRMDDNTDPTTHQPSRLMYYPTVSCDGEYVHRVWEGDPVDVDAVLNRYSDWKDPAQWPRSKAEKAKAVAENKVRGFMVHEQADPTEKKGIVGAFCRTYLIDDAIEKYLSDVYIPYGRDRYTYKDGSTSGGAVKYDDKWLYSHHSTDPAQGCLMNAWDLVRIHKFGDLDSDAPEGTTGTALPSYKAMEKLAMEDKNVKKRLDKERFDEIKDKVARPVSDYINAAKSGTGDIVPPSAPPTTPPTTTATVPDDSSDDRWVEKLTMDGRGRVLEEPKNYDIILNNDPNLKDLMYYDELMNKRMISRKPAWDDSKTVTYPRAFKDRDYAGYRNYLRTTYKLAEKSSKIAEDALAVYIQDAERSVNPITQYLDGLEAWDGVPRVESLFIDFLGADDTEYTRAVTKCSLVAAVTRAYKPGTKFDNMLILKGEQGIGKSRIIKKLAKNKWAIDGIKDFDDRPGEKIQGGWLIEISELEAMKKSEATRCKQFLALDEDKFRKAYGRESETYPRRCVFFGSTNDENFLTDRTGNRRYWTVPVDISKATKSIWDDLDDEVDQIWAEAVKLYRDGTPLYLSKDIEQQAVKIQNEYVIKDDREGIVQEFVSRKVPIGWDSKSLAQRLDFWADYDIIMSQLNDGAVITDDDGNDIQLVERNKVCALEVWVECFGKSKSDIKRTDSAMINNAIGSMEGWKKTTKPVWFKEYGAQRGFVKE